ncbi:MAG: flagellar filament capping protein FliD, partial [Nitrospinota bacterium]
SGINYNDLVTGLMQLERRPVSLLQSRQNDYEVKIAAILNLSTKLSSYKSSLEALNSSEKFNIKTASVTKTSSGEELLTVSSSSSAAVGSYSIQVNQLAAASKEASQGWVDDNTTAIASGSGSLRFKVGSGGAVTTISINNSMTLQGLRDEINTADGGVTASIINDGTGSNPYRLILTADNTGSSNDVIITQNNTDLDFTNKKVEAAYAYTNNSYSGTVQSNSGDNSSTYASTTNKTFLVEVVGAGASNTATYKYSVDGGITWLGYNGITYDSTKSSGTDGAAVTTTTDYTSQWIDGLGSANSNNGNVKVQFSSGSDLALEDRFTIDVFNPEMQEARDAVIEVDNATIVKSSNTITDAIQGITMNLLKVDTSSTLTLTVSSDTSSAKSSIENFVESYNSLYEFINDQLSYDPDTEAKADPLLGDPTLLEIRRKIGNAVTGTIPGLSTAEYTNLSQIGITSDYKTGQLSLDETKLNNALSSDSDAVAKLFIGTAAPTNQAITFVSKTSETQAGTYSIYISTAPEQATLSGDVDLSSNGLSSNETLTFMYSENYTETSPTYTTFSVTLNAGDKINTIVSSLNSTFATNNVGLSATNNNGNLKITSTDYGADVWFQVSNDYTGGSTYQIWSSESTRKDAGVDIVGNINNHRADGDGNILTSKSGFAEDGLKISTTSNQTGLFGTISVSLGIADRLPSILDSYVDSTSGVLKSKESSIQKTVDDIEDQISRIEERLADKEQRLRDRFARLEVLLAKYQTQGDYLANQLGQLSNLSKMISNR